MTDKLFTVAGTSTLNGVTKYRFANSLQREAVLRKGGHTDIKLVELPRAMNKQDAVTFLSTQKGFDKVSAKANIGAKVKTNAAVEAA